jgi:hypothetical protein
MLHPDSIRNPSITIYYDQLQLVMSTQVQAG